MLRPLPASLISLLTILVCALSPPNCVLAKDILLANNNLPSSNILPAANILPMKVSNVETENAIWQIDRQLFMDCIIFARFNINFRLQANYHNPNRDWLYPLGQEAGTAAVFANTVIDLDQRAKGLSNLNNISISAQKNGLSSAITGNAIRGSSSLLELTQNVLVQQKATRNGFSPRQSILFVKARLDEANVLLSQRASLVQALESARERQIFELHERLYKQILQQLLAEFIKWSINSREVTWRENTFYVLNTTQNFVLCSSSILSLNSFSNAPLKGASAVTSIVGNSISTLSPPTRTLVGVAMRKYQRHNLAKTFAQYKMESIPEWKTDWRQLKRIIPEQHPDSVDEAMSELSFLSNQSNEIDKILERETVRIEKLRRVAAQQAISGPLIGLAALSRSILSGVAYYDYPNEPETRNKLAFAGLIAQTAGQTYSLINTPTVAIANYRYKRKLAKKGELPRQILTKRLATLDSLEAQLKAEHPWVH